MGVGKLRKWRIRERWDCARTEAACEMRKNVSPRIERKKVKDILILSGKHSPDFSSFFVESSNIKKASVTKLSFGDGVKDTTDEQLFADMEGTTVVFDDMSRAAR